MCVCLCVCVVFALVYKHSSCISQSLPLQEEEAALQESVAENFADPDGEDEDELQNDLQDNNQRYSAKDPVKPFSLYMGREKDMIRGPCISLNGPGISWLSVCLSTCHRTYFNDVTSIGTELCP